ncbi:hypothetical protein D3C81_1706860 [compost metagenome]
MTAGLERLCGQIERATGMPRVGACTCLIDVVRKLLCFSPLRIWKPLQCVSNRPPCLRRQHRTELLQLGDPSCQFCGHLRLTYTVTFPVDPGHPLVMQKSVVAMGFMRERPFHAKIVSEAHQEHTLTLLGNAEVRSIHQRRDDVVGVTLALPLSRSLLYLKACEVI